MLNSERFQQAVECIDACHRQDPRNQALDHAGTVSRWVKRLRPDPSEALVLAARAQHIRRWEIPRDSYPANRAGYLRWRAKLMDFHAAETAAILEQCGYSTETVERVRALMRKVDLEDAETQALEDALCLTFMERQLAEFASRHHEPKLERILRKTWAKMSPAGREAALGLELDPAIRDLLKRSLR